MGENPDDISYQIKIQKIEWQKNDVSDVLEKSHSKKISSFMNFFKNEEVCQERLIKWLGWTNNEKQSRFKCPKCGWAKAWARPKKEGKYTKTTRLIFECKNKDCTQMPSPRCVTIMVRSSIPLRFWFLCIYVIGLMQGKVPLKYLNKCRVDFKDGHTTKTYQRRDVQKIIYKILETCKEPNQRMRYGLLTKLRFPNHKPLKSYLHWYKSENWANWQIAFQRDQYTAKEAQQLIDNSLSSNDIVKVYTCKKKSLCEGEWLLLTDIDDNSIGNIEWFYVSKIMEVAVPKRNIDGNYQQLALFLKEDHEEKVNYPFKLGNRFKKSLRSCLESDKDFFRSLSSNKVRVLSTDRFQEIANNFKAAGD